MFLLEKGKKKGSPCVHVLESPFKVKNMKFALKKIYDELDKMLIKLLMTSEQSSWKSNKHTRVRDVKILTDIPVWVWRSDK